MLLLPTPDAPVLRVRYDTEGLLTAMDVGGVLEEFGKGFDRYSRRVDRRGALRLAVQRIEVGSLIADFVVVASVTAVGVMQHREALYGFIGFLSDLLTVAQGLKPGKSKAADARLIEVLQRPIADGGAQQVNVFVLGDGNSVVIDRDAIQLIRVAREEAQLRSSAETAATQRLDPETERPLSALPPPKFLTLEGKFGTAIDVKGRWYVRLEGEGGVLNPLELAPDVVVQDERSYSFDGAWEGRSYRIRAAHPIG